MPSSLFHLHSRYVPAPVEEGGSITLFVDRTLGQQGFVSTSYRVENPGTDFVSTGGFVFFPAGVSTQQIQILTRDDDEFEYVDTACVRLAIPACFYEL